MNTKTNRKAVAERIREVLERNNLTQQEFAQNAGVSSATVSRVLAGVLPVAAPMIDQLIAMNENIHYILTGQHFPDNNPEGLVPVNPSVYGEDCDAVRQLLNFMLVPKLRNHILVLAYDYMVKEGGKLVQKKPAEQGASQ